MCPSPGRMVPGRPWPPNSPALPFEAEVDQARESDVEVVEADAAAAFEAVLALGDGAG